MISQNDVTGLFSYEQNKECLNDHLIQMHNGIMQILDL